MKSFLSAVCMFVFALTVSGATQAQLDAWKKQFPVVSPGRAPQLYEMASPYFAEVKQTTPANLDNVVRSLLAKADQDLAKLNEKAKSLTEPKVKKRTPASAEWFDTYEQINWFTQRLVPFLKKMQPK